MDGLRVNLELQSERDDALLEDLARRAKKRRAERIRQLAYLGLVMERAGAGLAGFAGVNGAAGMGGSPRNDDGVANEPSGNRPPSGVEDARKPEPAGSLESIISEAVDSSWGDIGSI